MDGLAPWALASCLAIAMLARILFEADLIVRQIGSLEGLVPRSPLRSRATKQSPF